MVIVQQKYIFFTSKGDKHDEYINHDNKSNSTAGAVRV